jgi:hypothetical protein
MWHDPIIAETRRLRESYAAEHNHDLDAIFEDLLRRQASTSRKVIALPPRRPKSAENRDRKTARNMGAGQDGTNKSARV